MSDTAYDSLSAFYNNLQSEVDVRVVSDRICALIAKYGPAKGDGEAGNLIVCDLGCGTGSVAFELAGRGYEIIAIDRSGGMLAAAGETFAEGGREALFVRQDISRLDLFGTVDVFLSLTDTLNHLTDARAFRRVFASLRNFLNPGGLFVFDLLTLRYMRDVRGSGEYSDISDDYALIWQNRFNEKTGSGRSDMTLFSRSGENLYKRSDFSVAERYYSEEDVRDAMKSADLELVGIFSGYINRKAREDDVRHLYVTRRRA
ncbi:MAG: methyltransferase domain-containing protein [Clostridiaceae bacterium]|jgi:SAM-dependent methyltransferase|nr:methyltransferase domain-containing protein [Oscillospiraceae bacterium]NLO63090.1 methyltransferase domain-containing protein [Clostridiaceae bacterium]